MFALEKINLELDLQKKELKLFLSSCGLELDSLDCAFGFYDDNGGLAACGGKEKNILKCFAVKDEFKGQNLLNGLLSAVLSEAYLEGFERFFVFTKISACVFFLEAGFEEVEKAEDSVLLFKGEKTPHGILERLYAKYCPQDFNSTPCGAAVLNANPFTLGHRYLVETALKECRKLYVFVVEADKSFFSFADRFYLVKKNTEDLKNVCVLPSSEFLISSATFPSYFLKNETLVLKNQIELDAKIFSKYFVPVFNIDKRFLGDEPVDVTTAAYNAMLQKILPPVCSVKIIDRKKIQGKPVSASEIRKALKAGLIEETKQMLPSVTFEFLKKYKF